MIKKLKKLWLMLTYSTLVSLPSTVSAQLGGPPPVGGVPQSTLPELITRIINWVLTLAGLVAVVVLIYGGFRYITSGGDDQQTTAAKNTILYAIIGLIIIGLSWAIVSFVVGSIQDGNQP